MKVTFNNGFYIVKTETREAHYRADRLEDRRVGYQAKIKAAQRALKDLEAIAQYIEESNTHSY